MAGLRSTPSQESEIDSAGLNASVNAVVLRCFRVLDRYDVDYILCALSDTRDEPEGGKLAGKKVVRTVRKPAPI